MKLPDPDPQTGYYPTLNRMGGMSPVLDEFSQAWVDFPTEGVKLDVGACYGLAVQAALEQGATVWANDLEPAHLQALAPHPRLTLLPGPFPTAIPWEHDKLGAVLLARVLHYLDGDTVDRGLKLIRDSLRPRGEVFGVTVTPRILGEEYAERKATGERWPGELLIDSPGLPPVLNLMDEDVLAAALTRAGLQVEKLQPEGPDGLGFVASRPC